MKISPISWKRRSIIQVIANGPGNATSSDFYSHNNLNYRPGQDYAIQVQEFKANFKGYLTPDGAIRWKVNVFGIDKEGDRQVNALTHCYNASITYPGYPMTSNPTVTRQCHILSSAPANRLANHASRAGNRGPPRPPDA